MGNRDVSGATILDGQGQGTILNDDSPVLSINDVALSEGNSGTTTFTFTVSSSLPAPAGGNHTRHRDGGRTRRSLAAQRLCRAQSDRPKYSRRTDVLTLSTLTVERRHAWLNPAKTFFVNVIRTFRAQLSIWTARDRAQFRTTTRQSGDQSGLSGGGSDSSAHFSNDFMEMFNRGTHRRVDFSVTPYSVQFLSTAGSTWAKTD